MAGKGNISVNQTPQYGDKAVLEEMSKATTTTPMSGAVTPRPTAGRPSGTSQQPQPQPTSGGVPDNHFGLMIELRDAYKTHQYWQSVVAQYPSEWSVMYAKQAQREFEQKQYQLRNATPFFR